MGAGVERGWRGQIGIAVLAAFASAVSAGEIYGKVTLNGAPVAEGTEVSAQCGEAKYPAVKTDKSGTYNLVVNETGKCVLAVKHKADTATVNVASYDDAAQADLVLEIKDGKLTARRR